MPDEQQGWPSLLDAQALRVLLRQLEATDVEELEVVFGSSRLYIRREPGRHTAHEKHGRAGHAPSEGATALVAPLTGIFYRRSAPELEPFVQVGDCVEIGQVVALIETMKLFNEVVAESAGPVVSIEADDGDLVEAGQPLIYVGLEEEGERS